MKTLTTIVAAVLCILLMSTTAWGQTTYTWSGGTSGNWATAGNWTPTRTTPATDDVLVFNTSSIVTLDFASPETIGQFQITGNSRVVFIASAAHKVSIA
ncbi:MAG: hypothetical protein HW412_596, partial [Bacteroidetes bacterium]|nr:hypothetical protein [Bacteroidota bacterium]